MSSQVSMSEFYPENTNKHATRPVVPGKAGHFRRLPASALVHVAGVVIRPGLSAAVGVKGDFHRTTTFVAIAGGKTAIFDRCAGRKRGANAGVFGFPFL